MRGVLNNHLDDIKKALHKGYTKKNIYDSFKEEGLIKSDYAYFIKILNQLLKGKNQSKNKKPEKSTSDSFFKKKSFSLRNLTDEELS